jgi:hypothetical protein
MSFNGSGATQDYYPRSVTYLVASGDQALASGTLIPTSGNALNIASGQLGGVAMSDGFSIAQGDFIAAGNTVANAPVIQLVQGTPNSANVANVGPHMYNHKPYVASAPINSRYSIAFTAQACDAGQYNAFAVGGDTGTPQAIQVADTSVYRLNITFDGVMQNRYFSVSAFDGIHPSITTPNFTSLSALYTAPLDYIVQHLAYEVNLHSKAFSHVPGRGGVHPIVALAINTAGGAGTTLTAAAAQAVGSTLNVQTHNGVTQSLVVDQALKDTITRWIANPGTSGILGTSTIEVINTSTAGTASGKGTEIVVLLALDEDGAVVTDNVKPRKVRLRVGVDKQSSLYTSTLGNNELSVGMEELGTGARYKKDYDALPAMQVWSQERWGMNTNLIVPPSYIDTTKSYSANIIYHWDENFVEFSHTQKQPHKTVILTECDPATGLGTDTTTIASLNAILAPWLNSCTIERIEPGTSVTFI